MQYNLAVDSGGSKVQAILYDERFRPIRSCRVGSMRLNTTPPELAKCNAEQLICELGIEGAKIQQVNGIFEETLEKLLREKCSVQAFCRESEARLGYCAAGVFRDGCLVVAGTGATVFVRKGENEFSAGGYGSSLADEGSGYWMGKEGMMAAIRDYEERGPKTMLTDLIAAHMGGTRDSFRERIFAYVYNEKRDVSPVSHVAALSRLVSRGAGEGDAVSQDILARAGKLLALQAASMVQKHGMPLDTPIALMGSAWRADEGLHKAFQSMILEKGLTGSVHRPRFEPIVGSVISHHVRERGGFSAWDQGFFMEHYRAFFYDRE